MIHLFLWEITNQSIYVFFLFLFMERSLFMAEGGGEGGGGGERRWFGKINMQKKAPPHTTQE